MSSLKPRIWRLIRLLCFSVFVLVWGAQSLAIAGGMQVRNLKVDHLLHADLQGANGYPVIGNNVPAAQQIQQTVIANQRPTFGWEIAAETQNAAQSAYRVIVSRDREAVAKGVGDMWDSGKLASDESVNVAYDGTALTTNTSYLWRVMVWDKENNSSAWSDIARFVTADKLMEYKTSYYPLVKTDEVAQNLRETSGIIRLDFGRASFAQLKMTLSSQDGGESVTVRLGEAVHEDGSINRQPGGTIRYAEYQVKLRRGQHTYALQIRSDKRNTGPQAIIMPEYIGEVFPFRYCEIEGYQVPLRPQDVARASVHYPFDDFASDFKSSDEVLNAVWDLCKYSIKATSFAGIYVDGDRERIPYEADAYINQLSHYAVDKEYSMARRSHEHLLHNATWPTEWILQSVLMAYNDYLYTGDLRSAAHFYGDLKAKLLLPLREKNGLISTTMGGQTEALLKSIHFKGKALRDIVDWPHTGGFGMDGLGETDGFVFTDYNAVTNAFHYKALGDMERLAAALGRTDDAMEFAARAKETYHAFQTLLWDQTRKVYRDGISTDHASLHTNMMALAFGLVPEERQAAVTDFLRSRGMACSVYGSQFLMDAIYDAGDAHYGLKMLTSQDDRSWYNMIRAGSTITMEAWDNKYKPNQDWNHAWGAVPANIIPRKLMGIEPTAPGWKEFRVRPQLADLQWATIRVPTIRGEIKLSCRQSAEEHVYILTVPANTLAYIELPQKETTFLSKITLNGNEVKTETQNGWIKLPAIGGGNYEVRFRN